MSGTTIEPGVPGAGSGPAGDPLSCPRIEQTKSPWNSLEAVKLLVGALIALAIALAGHAVTNNFRDQDAMKARRDAIQQLSRSILERRVRSEMLASALRRHSNEPVAASLDELIRRKKEYDDAYAVWNANIRAHMIALRQVSNGSQYSKFEEFLQKSMTNIVFKQIDDCLTAGYDDAIRSRDARPRLGRCGPEGNAIEIKSLLAMALNCGYALTEQPHLVASGLLAATDATSIIAQSCPKWAE